MNLTFQNKHGREILSFRCLGKNLHGMKELWTRRVGLYDRCKPIAGDPVGTMMNLLLYLPIYP